MTSTKKNRVSFGTPVDSIPEPAAPPRAGATHWATVADYVKELPGTWHPVRISHLTVQAHRAAVPAITRAADTGTDGLHAFREPGYQAAYRDGVLYVRYDTPAVTRLSRKKAS